MALDNPAPLEVLEAMQAGGVDDRVRAAAQTIYQALIDAEPTAVIGRPLERTDRRTRQRNGSRARTLSTTAGDLELAYPSSERARSSLLERRRRVDQAPFAVVMEAYLHGVSTRKVDDLVKALGADTGISKSEVSKICADLDEEVGALAVLIEAHDEWQVTAERRCLSEHSMELLTGTNKTAEEVAKPELMTAS